MLQESGCCLLSFALLKNALCPVDPVCCFFHAEDNRHSKEDYNGYYMGFLKEEYQPVIEYIKVVE